MFRRSEQPSAEPPAEQQHAVTVDAATLDDAIDTLAFTLRAIGRHGPRSPDEPGDEAQAQFEAWARHVLVGAPPPDAHEPEETPESAAARDWPAVRHAVVGHLSSQSEEIGRVLGDLRDVIWAFVGGLSKTLVDDATADSDAQAAVRRLQQAAAAGSTEQLKQAALETVAELEAIAESRKARQRDQARRLGEHISRLRGQLDEASREAERDGLTRVANRKLLDRELERAQELCTLVDEPSCLIMVDVDHFKQVNDAHGHPVGDDVLRSLADTIVRCFPRKTDIVARFGGDEFAVILRSAAIEDGARLATRLLENVREQAMVAAGGGYIRFSVSIGVTSSERLEAPAEWLARADRALYEAKAAGRDQVAVIRSDLAQAA